MNNIDIIYTALTSNTFQIQNATDWNGKRHMFRKIINQMDSCVDWSKDPYAVNADLKALQRLDHKLLTIGNFVSELSKSETKVRPQLNNFYRNGGMMPRSVAEHLTKVNDAIDELYQEIIQICLKL